MKHYTELGLEVEADKDEDIKVLVNRLLDFAIVLMDEGIVKDYFISSKPDNEINQ